MEVKNLHLQRLTFKKKHTKKLYSKVLFSFILMAILIVLSTSIIFSTMYIRNIYNQLSVDSINNVKKLTVEFDNTFKQIRDMNLYLTQVPDVNAFLYSSDMDDYLTINRADIISRQVTNLNPFIYSVILYNKTLGLTLLSGKLNLGKDQFMAEKLNSPDTTSNYNMLFSSVVPNGQTTEKPIETISIVFTDSDKKTLANDSGIVITVDREEIEKKLLGNIQGTTIVVDNSGKVIFNSSKDEIKSSISTESFFTKITTSKNNEDSFKFIINSNNKIVSYTRSTQTGFYIINIRTAEDYTGIIIRSELTVILVSIIILIIFLSFSYLISKNLYSPIKKVTELFTGSKYGSEDTQSGEIATISKVFNNALKHIKELETESVDNNIRLKEEYLRRLLRSDILTETISNNYKLNIYFSNLILICIRIDNYSNIEWSRKIAYETSLSSIIPEILSDNFICETVNMYHGEIALMLNFKDNTENDFNMLISDMDNLRNISRNTLCISFSIGIGGVSNSLEACISSYKKAEEMVKHRFVLGLDHTIYQRLLDDTLSTNLIYPTEMEDKLISFIRLNKRDCFIKTLNDIFEIIKRYFYSEAASTLFQIITACVKAINQIASQDNSKYSLHFDEFSTIFNSLETLDQAKQWLIKIFIDYQEMLEKINQLKNNKHYNTVEKMQDYINHNYQDPNINVESIADMAGYTSYYFSKIFKDITGLNVIDHIKQTRISKAKELLCMKEIKVSEIPAMIGFANSSHFYATFKKDVGLTPASYREYSLSNKGSD